MNGIGSRNLNGCVGGWQKNSKSLRSLQTECFNKGTSKTEERYGLVLQVLFLVYWVSEKTDLYDIDIAYELEFWDLEKKIKWKQTSSTLYIGIATRTTLGLHSEPTTEQKHRNREAYTG